MGAPSKCTEANRIVFCESMELAPVYSIACGVTGISYAAFQLWRDRAKNGEEPYLSFIAAVQKAKAKGQRDRLELINAAAKDNWPAAAWILERTAPDDFGRKARLEHTGEGGGPVKVQVLDMSKMSEEQVAKLALGEG